MYLLSILVTFLAISFNGISATPLLRQSNTDRFLDLVVTAKTQKVQLVWKNLDVNGKIVLRSGPELGSQVLLQQLIVATNGSTLTNVFYNYTFFRGIINSNTSCYGYYADFYVNKDADPATQADLSACMMAYPRWMQNMRSVIGPKAFREVYIPGTHDSGAYKANYDLTKDENIINKYTLTQDEDIRGQLLAGVRYLDLRPAYYSTNAIKWWINHGSFQIQPIEPLLRDISNFVKETNEIVVVSMGEFPVGFSSLDIHRQFIQFVNATIGDQIIVNLPKQWNVTLNKIWNNSNRRIILSYANDAISAEFTPFTWPAVFGLWANTDNIATLKDYFYRANNDGIYSMLPIGHAAELTPTTMGVIFDSYNGLRTMADNTNPQVSEWYRYDLGLKANFVSLDFVRGTTVIKDSMKWNVNPNRPVANL